MQGQSKKRKYCATIIFMKGTMIVNHAHVLFGTFLFLVVSIGAIVLIVLGIVCIADSQGVGYCTEMTFGSFFGLLITGLILAFVCLALLCCIRCCISTVENI